MKRRSLLWHIYLSYLLIILVSLCAVTWHASVTLRNFHLEQTAHNLESRARLTEKQISKFFDGTGDFSGIDGVCKTLGAKSDARTTVILPSGKVVGDSDEDPAHMDNHANRREITESMQGRTGSTIRYSRTLRRQMMYLAIPLKRNGRIRAVVRTSLPVLSIQAALAPISAQILWGSLAIAMLSALLGLLVSRRISRPIEEMKKGAERFANGELQFRLNVPATSELASLATTLNRMAVQLDERIDTIRRQRNEQEAVLSSMTEGVLAVDDNGRILNINRAGAELLGLDRTAAVGRILEELLREADFHTFVSEALTHDGPSQREIEISRFGGRMLQMNATALRDADENRIGLVVVLNDVTQVRRLESMRRDFVSNVSHELKTPITSIKGFVETLQDGALEDPADARRFLDIIARHTTRLDAIIEDLLVLSRIEKKYEAGVLERESYTIRDTLSNAISVCHPKAEQKSITVELVCDDSITAHINALLIEQAVVNLIDNAVKYSHAGTQVTVRAETDKTGIHIAVSDQGHGITTTHLPRIFERFYRISREKDDDVSGTGLGLAIVKHIAQAHNGTVTVDSTPGKGSTFSIHLPQ